MKPPMFVPPAQAEALCDTQDELRDDLRLDDRAAHLPWRDEENLEEPRFYRLPPRREPAVKRPSTVRVR